MMHRAAPTMIAASLAALWLAACGPKVHAPVPPPPPPPQDVDQTLWAGLARSDARALRAMMMRAQIEVALRLVGEGAGGVASGHVLRALTDYYAPAKSDYAHLGLSLDEKAFRAASSAAANGAPRRDFDASAQSLLRQIRALQPRDGYWSKPATAKRLMEELAHQYGEGVQGGFVVNEQRYQDAYGLAIVARSVVRDAIADGKGKDASRIPELEREAEGLVNMFPSARAPASPASAGEVLAQISRVEMAFPAME